MRILLTILLLFPLAAFAAEGPKTPAASDPETPAEKTVFGKTFVCIDGLLNLKQGHYLLPVRISGGKITCPKEHPDKGKE